VLLWFVPAAGAAEENYKSSHLEPQTQPGQGIKAQDAGKQPDYSIRVNVPVVTLDASVLTSDGLFVPGSRPTISGFLKTAYRKRLTVSN
jgi:hypothetical protein